jgi:hypothetical protein
MNTPTQDLEQRARQTLEKVELMGEDWIKGSLDAKHLRYGLEHGLYDLSAVDSANTKFRESQAKYAIEKVELMGEEWIKESLGDAPHLQYGLEHKLFKQADVDAAQKRYEDSRSSRRK